MTKAQEKKVAAVARAKEAELLLAGARATKDYATFFANSSVNVVEAVRGQYWDNDLPLGMDFSKVSSHQLMVIRTYLLAQMKQAKQVEDLVTREMKRRSFPFIAVVRTTRQKLSPSAVKSLSEFHGINVVYDVSDDVLIDKKINDVIMNELLNTYVALHRTVHTVARDLANPQFMVNLMSQDPTDRPLGAPELPLVIPYLSEPAPFFALVLKNPSELAAFSIVPFDKLSTTDAAAVKL